MSIRVISWVMNHAPTKRPVDVLLLVAIGDHCDHNGKGARPSYTTLQDMTRLSRQSVVNILERLEEGSSCLAVTKGTRQHANRYEIRIVPVPGCDRVCCNWEGRRGAQLSLSLVNVVDQPKTAEVVNDVDPRVVNDVVHVDLPKKPEVVNVVDHVVNVVDQGSQRRRLDPLDPLDPLKEREYALPRATPSAPLLAEPSAEPTLLSTEPDPEILRTLWNELTQPPIPRCADLTKQRRTAAKARLRHRGIDAMRDVFTRINASDFLRGSKGWTATFDWALKDANIIKVLEGNYDNGKNGHPQRPPGRTGAPAPGKYAGLTKGATR